MNQTKESNLYGNMSYDLEHPNNISKLGRSVLKKVEQICLKNRYDDKRLVKELKMYGINLEAMQR